jgi:hypothetical protein
MAEESRKLELRAAEQRHHLQGSVHHLREAIQHKLDVRANARQHLGAASGIAFLVTTAVGYSLADMIYRMRSRRFDRRDLRWYASR